MKYVCYSLLLFAFAGLSACDVGPGSALTPESASDGAFASATITAGGAGDPTHWSAMSAEELWAHVAALDSTVTVGMKEPGQRKGVDDRGRSLVPQHRWQPLSRQVEALGGELLYLDDFHPLMELRLSGPDQIEALRRSPFVEFVEPASFDPAGVLMSKCGSSSVHRTGGSISPGDIVPYTLTEHQVPEAWQLATGAGKTIGIVDTGTSVYQPQLQERFDDGQSAGRTITYDHTDANGENGPPPWHDTCGHGTKALGLAAAPRDGQNIVGVAYGANVFAVRALDDPGAGLGQWGEVREGIRRAALNADIVNMAFGWSWGDSGTANTIRNYYYDPDYETLFIGAAGSSTQWLGEVVFPAELPEVVAVTGTWGGTSPCNGCNYGPEVEFAAYTAGQTTGSNTGDIGDVDAIGKSSGATAIVSGIAALVWSRYPSWTRDQVLSRMRDAAQFTGQPRSDIGHGTISALHAVGGLASASLVGPDEIYFSGTYAFEINHQGGSGPFTYQWTTGETTKRIMMYIEVREGLDYTTTVSGTVTDENGITRFVSKDVLVQGDFGLGSG